MTSSMSPIGLAAPTPPSSAAPAAGARSDERGEPSLRFAALLGDAKSDAAPRKAPAGPARAQDKNTATPDARRERPVQAGASEAQPDSVGADDHEGEPILSEGEVNSGTTDCAAAPDTAAALPASPSAAAMPVAAMPVAAAGPTPSAAADDTTAEGARAPGAVILPRFARAAPADAGTAQVAAAGPHAASAPAAPTDMPQIAAAEGGEPAQAKAQPIATAANETSWRATAEVERNAPPWPAPMASTPPLSTTGANVAADPGAAPMLAGHVSPPLTSPLFAPALATQVRWLVGQGVSQAQLQLHPAEMGPVSVRIVVEGREARIEFGADVAATRQVLEASLPVLAAALDDSGLKFAGGSVRDGQGHAQQQGQEPRGHGGARAATVPPEAPRDAGVRTESPRPARGLVDLVA